MMRGNENATPTMDDLMLPYHIKVRKNWFNGKDTFTERLNYYARQLTHSDQIRLPLNAGNMIYVMMQQLEIGVEWEKQDALITSYRDLMYKLSYTNVTWFRKDPHYLHIEGQKLDVMWTLAFITQVFPDQPIECETFVSEHDKIYGVEAIKFAIQNGGYVGENAHTTEVASNVLPNIWATPVDTYRDTDPNVMVYDSHFRPQSGESFAIPDGRIGIYLRMDERYYYAEQFGTNGDLMVRHNVSASLIKDFEDLIWAQTKVDYDIYQMRYVAFMNKVHELEKLMGGLEISVYDILPVAECGLPYASKGTIKRTNEMDSGSIRYVIDKLQRNKSSLRDNERVEVMREAAISTLNRLRGYDTEYSLYQTTGSHPGLCVDIRWNQCTALYNDFAEMDAFGILRFPRKVYQALCNDPEHSVYKMTEFERQKLTTFGRGYLDFLTKQINGTGGKRRQTMCANALSKLQQRYLMRK